MLTVALVPRTCWWSNVRTNVPRRDWERCKNYVKNRSEERCEICGGVGRKHPVECHEIWQYDDLQHIQTLVDLIALCPACHSVKHIGRMFAIGHAPEAIIHLMKVNNWPLHLAERHIADALSQWEERSRHQWQLDVSFLETIGVELPAMLDRETTREVG